MAIVRIDINKPVEQNASAYYDGAKKIKKKIAGAREALEETRHKLKKLEKEQERHSREAALEMEKKAGSAAGARKEWYDKFRWFISSEGFLVIGGRDATTNEILVKKHTSKGDLVFHTDMVGSPFFAVQAGNKKVGKKTIQEAADATAAFSRAWKMGMQNSSVFYCTPEQLTKEAPSGEYVPRGGFITKGKLNYIDNRANCAVGIYNGKVMAGPVEAVKKNCEKYVEIKQGRDKASAVAKNIQKKIGGNIDEIIRALPSGGCRISK
ncbi:DUF814 domain-containing protein [Candidatus Woesearchaeota archaeon]|nr:DUF814 domain-containing protein [Candidatus Woesearchaeota archaeon]